MKKLVFAGAILLFTAQLGYSQVQDPNSPGYDLGTAVDSTTNTGTTDNPYQTEENPQEEATPAKPYERIVLNMDTLTNLIVYSGVVEQPESTSDSLYLRTKKWATKRFGENKAMYEVDKKNQKLIINGTIPAYSYSNKYAKHPIGKYHFKLTLLFKEERYKYSITNLVHEGEKPNVGEPVRNYFEYYYTTTSNIRNCDQILRFADKDINAMLEDLKKNLKDKPVVDEDDW